jgi:prolyl 3-hydroxylase /prolyl 3,4-dihydroxylase
LEVVELDLDLTTPFSDGLLDEGSGRVAFKASHEHSTPYKHLVIDNLVKDPIMRRVHDETIQNLRTTLKESDLFKVFQTNELGNIDESDAGTSVLLRHLLALRTALYSPSFRSFVADVMGVDDLTDRVDCSCNAYTQGCHLLCHDDVIGTRRVSYIIYLTDPDEPWEDEDGGALELYPLTVPGDAQGIPAPLPTTNIAPRFNRMAMFKVQPGRSYHSVQEVYADKPRLSISGWFHGPTPPEGSDQASLKLLMAKGDDSQPFETIFPDPGPANAPVEGELSPSQQEADRKVLAAFINPVYLEEGAIKQINRQFCDESSIQLHSFLKEDLAEDILKKLLAEDKRSQLGDFLCPSSYNIGLQEWDPTMVGWAAEGPSHKRRHLQHSGDQGAFGLERVREHLFKVPAFARFLEELTCLRPRSSRAAVRRFRPGLDYTVAHHGAVVTEPRLDATLCFVDDGALDAKEKEKEGGPAEEAEEEDDDDSYEPTKADKWDSGDVGAFECYITSDGDEGEAAEVYKAKQEEEGDDSQLLSVSPGFNVLSLVMRDQDTLRFIKYVSAAAPSSRWDVCAEYEIEPLSDDSGSDSGSSSGSNEEEGEEA